MSRRGVIRCAVAAVLFGASAPAASRLAGEMSAFTLAGLLYVGAALAVLPFSGAHRPARVEVLRAAPRLAVAVVVGGAIGPVFLAIGLRTAPAATVSLLLNLEVVFTAALAAALFREHLGGRVIAGTTLVVAAGVVLAWSGEADLRASAFFVAGACMCWAIDNNVTAKLDELAPVHITLVKGAVAGGVNLVLGLFLGVWPAGWQVVAALLVGGVGYGASITLWVAGAREIGAARGQLVFATAPFVGAVVAWTVFTEPVIGRQVVSLALALAGVAFVLRSDHVHEHTHASLEHDHEHSHDDGHHDHAIDDPSHHDPADEHEPGWRHQHRHRHGRVVHAHPHVPDLHHRHQHAG